MVVDPDDKPFSAVRVAIWALGVLGLVLSIALTIVVLRDQTVPPALSGVLGAIVGGLTMAAGGKQR